MHQRTKIAVAVTMAVSAMSAFAQTTQTVQPAAETSSIQRVEVTGSRIASPNAESPSPLQVLSSADIAASGATNLQELLQKNPTLGAPALSRTNSNFFTSGGGVATVDLRNLGTARTLVLLNGRRFVTGVPGSSAVDLNTIPTDFIERVELLTGGASATYGSDAVAGVVNIITKRNLDGLLADFQAGRSEQGDDLKRKASLTFGKSSEDGRSNVMAHLGYSRQGAVYSRDRDFAAVDQLSRSLSSGDPADIFIPTRPAYSGVAPQGLFMYRDSPTATTQRNFTYDRAGNIIPWNQNGSATQAATGFNRSEYRSIAVPTERYVLATVGNLALNENHSAFFEGNYASTRVSTKMEPYPMQSTDVYPRAGLVPAEFMVNGAMVRNPLVPQYLYDRATDTNGDGARDYSFSRRMSEVGTRGYTVERDTFRLATGLKGSFGIWNYETYLSYGSTKEAQQGGGQINVLNFRNALEAIPDANGNAICRDPIARIQGCVPINVFGYDTISPEALRYVNAPGSLVTAATQKLAGATVSGEPFQLPAGALGIAAGFEWREETSRSEADALTQAGLNAGNAAPPTYGEFSVKEYFLEARVPLLKDLPFVKSLSASTAIRRGDYSTVGTTDSWNVGAEWSPISDVKFRATRALSTRAPNIDELYQPAMQTFPTGLIDPCIGVTATSTGAVSEACRAAPGVNANIAANGRFTLNQSDTQGVSGYNRGNPLLGEEKGRSTTIGVVVTPRSIPLLSKFTFTADYFDIKIADAIVSTPRQFALDQCYGGGNTALCSFITRRPTVIGANSAGSLDEIDSAATNSGGVANEGVDVTVAWADRVGPGRLNARLSYTRLLEGYDIPLPGAERDVWAGEVGDAKHRAGLNLGYAIGNFKLNSTVTYIGRSALDDGFLGSFEVDNVPLAPESIKIASTTYVDFQATYQLTKAAQLYAGVDNAFDRAPPPIISGLPGNSTGTETDASTYDPIGRRYYVGLRVSL
ncbi:MAG: iron complex outerrane recepter protein [Massilia sp.]|jgi:outer membrane receptor protein involved in Fe transport